MFKQHYWWIPLYLGTILLEFVFSVLPRVLLLFVFVSYVLMLPFWIIMSEVYDFYDLDLLRSVNFAVALNLALVPHYISYFLLFFGFPYEYIVTKWKYGARKAVYKDLAILKDVLNDIELQTPTPIDIPKYLFIIPDKYVYNAFVIGRTLYVTEGLLYSPYVRGVIAHELGYINSGVGKVKLALASLAPLSSSSELRKPVGNGLLLGIFTGGCGWGGCLALLFILAAGGISQPLHKVIWRPYWRRRTFAFDEFAWYCNMGHELAGYLEHIRMFESASPYYGSDKPYVEERLDHLQRLFRYGKRELRYLNIP